jgi:signal transduction histidine kinase
MNDSLYRLVNAQTEVVIIDDIPPDQFKIISQELIRDGSIKIAISGRQAKALKLSNDLYVIYLLTFDGDLIKSNRLLKTEAQIILTSAFNIDGQIQKAKDRAESQTKRLIHNLKSLSAKTTQEIYFVALQSKLMESPRDALRYLEKQVSQSPREAAKAFLEILKHNTAQRAEFSAFHKLNGDVITLSKESHKIHKVLMNVFYLFFQDFTDKGVTVDVSHSDMHGLFDYESIHVCIYHIVENAAKYIKNGGRFSVSVTRLNGDMDVIFDMESLLIGDNETDRIFLEGISGDNAINEQLQGTGIGLYLARRMATINGGYLRVLNGRPLVGTPKFARNRFTLTLPAGAGI